MVGLPLHAGGALILLDQRRGEGRVRTTLGVQENRVRSCCAAGPDPPWDWTKVRWMGLGFSDRILRGWNYGRAWSPRDGLHTRREERSK
jgi:hypothetical protein